MAETPGYVSNAELAARLSTLVDRWNTRENQMISLLSQESGNVTVTDGLGVDHVIPSIRGAITEVTAKLDDLTGAAAQAAASATQAAASAVSAANSLGSIGTSVTTAQTHATNAANSASSAATSNAAASTHETNAANSASVANTHKNSAATSATNAAGSATNANTAYTDANTAKVAAQSARDLANSYANAPANTEVEPGNYSAKHWALQAQSSQTGALVYMGSWSAAGGTFPGSPVKGQYYKVSAAGTAGGTPFAINDSIIYNGTTWDKIDNTDAVASVAGKTGAVTLVMNDITDKGALATLSTVDWTTHVTGKPSTFAPSTHSHAISEVTGLQTALDGKIATNTAAVLSSVSTTGYVSGLLEHKSGYLVVKPYNGTYDDGSKVEMYYNGNGRQLNMYARDSGGSPGPLRITVNGIDLMPKDGGAFSGAITSTASISAAGLATNQVLATAVNDFSKQLQLWAGYGMSITTNQLNFGVATTAASWKWNVATTAVATLNGVGDFTVSGDVVAAGVVTAGGIELGYRNLPFTTTNAAYTFVKADHGKLRNTTNGGWTWTVPSAVFAAGDVITVMNQSTGNVTLAQGSGMGLYLAGSTGAQGNRVLGPRGIATIVFCSGTVAIVSGNVT